MSSSLDGYEMEMEMEDEDFEELESRAFRQHNKMPQAQDSDSNEDTEEASETDMINHEEPREIKEKMYQEALENLNLQIQQLNDLMHPEFIKREKNLQTEYTDRLQYNKLQHEYMQERIEHDYVAEKKASVKEFEEKKVELKENLIADFEDKKRHIENERHNMELNGDSMEVKPAMTRKLRRRPNDPVPVPDKRRKPLTTNIVLLLDDRDIDSDLRQISRARPVSANQSRKQNVASHSPSPQTVDTVVNPTESRAPSPNVEARVEDGKLLYEKRWFHRGQSVFVEGRDYPRFPAHITAIGSECIWVKKVSPEGYKLKIYTSLLAQGKITIKRRAP